MRAIQTILLCAILVAVGGVYVELHRIASALAPIAAWTSPVMETRAERNLRLQQQTRESIEDAKAILETPTKPSRAAVTRVPPKTHDRDPQPR